MIDANKSYTALAVGYCVSVEELVIDVTLLATFSTVDGNLASAKVPEEMLEAFNQVRDAPDPENAAEYTVPVVLI